MLRVRLATSGSFLELETTAAVGKGGEASVYSVHGYPSLVAKIYHKQTRERAAKLAVMISNPPRNPTESMGHTSFAWPRELLCDANGNGVVGFLMNRVTGMREIFDFYNPGQRRRRCPYFDHRYLIQAARNVAGIIGELHSKNYVVGDVNQKNILVADSALVTVLDTDSFQVTDPRTGELHLCRVKTDGFIAPEYYRLGCPTDLALLFEWDLFGLGVLIFHLLMEGVHPFGCRYRGAGEPPTLQENIAAGRFPYGINDARFEPLLIAPPFEMLTPEVRSLFLRCFIDGHSNPKLRPSAAEWQRTLAKAKDELQVCRSNQQHYYAKRVLHACPWCGRVQMGLRDSFPLRTQITSHGPSNGIEPPPFASSAPAKAKRNLAILLLSPFVLIGALMLLLQC